MIAGGFEILGELGPHKKNLFLGERFQRGSDVFNRAYSQNFAWAHKMKI